MNQSFKTQYVLKPQFLCQFFIILFASWLVGLQLWDHDLFEYWGYYKIMFEDGWNPDDYWVQAHSWINVRSGFLLHIRALELLFGLQSAFFVAYAITFVACLLAVMRLAKRVGQLLNMQSLHYWTVVLMVSAPSSKYLIEMIGGNDVIYDHLKSSFAATAVALWAVVLWLEDRPRFAFFLAGYAVFLHIQFGGLVVLVLLILTIYENRWDFKKTCLDVCPALFWSPLPLWLVFELLVKNPPIDSQVLFNLMSWRMPHHILPSAFGESKWRHFATRLLFALILMMFIRRHKSCFQRRLVALGMTCFLAIGAVSILIEWGDSLWAAQTQAFRLDFVICLLAAMGLSAVFIFASKKWCRSEWVLPSVFLVSLTILHTHSRQENLKPFKERFRNLEIPGESSNEIDVFFQKAKPYVEPNAVVLATGGAAVQGRVRLLWNTPLFFGYKSTPQNRSIWLEYYERGQLQQQFENKPSLELIEQMKAYQTVQYIVSDQKILQMKPLFQHGTYRLYDLQKAPMQSLP